MEEFMENLMKYYTINQDGQLELSLVKMIEDWDLNELFTVSINTSNKEV